MSKTTKRKHVTKEALTEYFVPEGDEEVVKVLGGRGNNLHEVEAADGRKFLVSMPTKFRKNLWVKRGDFVVINPIKEGNKVLAEIIYVLYSKQIKYLQDQELWPERFTENKNDMGKTEEKSKINTGTDSCSESDDNLLFENPNRKQFLHIEESDSCSSEDDESDLSEEGNENDRTNVEALEKDTTGADVALDENKITY